MFNFIISRGEYTDSDVEQTVQKAELLSQDFSKIVFLENVDKISSFHDPVNKKEVKSVVFRLTSEYVLEAKYDESNKIIFSEIIISPSISKTLGFITAFVIYCIFLFITFNYGSELICAYKERKREEKLYEEEDDKEIDEKRIRTVSEKRGFLRFKR